MVSSYARRGFRDGGLSKSAGEYRLYRFYGHDGALLYVGVTGRAAWRRLIEHVGDKPWADEMACWEVDRRVWATEREVLAAEKQAIYDECPRYNIAGNGNNPHRVVAQRQQRRQARRPVRRRPVLGFRPGWWVKPAFVAGVWLALAGALWWASADQFARWDGVKYSGAGSAAIIGGMWWASRPKRRRRRRCR